MSQAETQLIITLQEVARTIASLGKTASHSRWDTWGPSLTSAALSLTITVVGWGVIVRSNKVNNQELLKRQLREVAANRILDALEDYVSFLHDAEFPKFATLHDIIADPAAPGAAVRADAGRPAAPIPMLVRSKVTLLMMFDQRATRWAHVLDRDPSMCDGDQRAQSIVSEMASSQHAIMGDLYQYQEDLDASVEKGKESAEAFVKADRRPEAITRIDDQMKRIDVLRSLVNLPNYLCSPRRPVWRRLQTRWRSRFL